MNLRTLKNAGPNSASWRVTVRGVCSTGSLKECLQWLSENSLRYKEELRGSDKLFYMSLMNAFSFWIGAANESNRNMRYNHLPAASKLLFKSTLLAEQITR